MTMKERRLMNDRLVDVQGYAKIAAEGWNEGDPDKALYWLEQVIKEAKDAIDYVVAPNVANDDNQA